MWADEMLQNVFESLHRSGILYHTKVCFCDILTYECKIRQETNSDIPEDALCCLVQ